MSLLQRLFRAKPKPDLQGLRRAAMERYEDAVRRGDTRDQSAAFLALREATNAALKDAVR